MTTPDWNTIFRKKAIEIKSYSSARSEFAGKAEIMLDANENNFGSPLSENFNRYPDPFHLELRSKLGMYKGISHECIFLGTGSDEAIDRLVVAACQFGADNIIIHPPTFGMYEVVANTYEVECKKVPLLPDTFQLDISALLAAIDPHTRIIFLCSPNNPTGNLLDSGDVELLLQSFHGLVVIDEAYHEFSPSPSWVERLKEFPHLVVLQTFSKGWGMAGLRCGYMLAHPYIIDMMYKIKLSYNLPVPTLRLVSEALDNYDIAKLNISTLIAERERLGALLKEVDIVTKVYPSAANFLLVLLQDAQQVYEYLLSKGIIVRNRSRVPLLENCLRISIGKPEENDRLLNALKDYI